MITILGIDPGLTGGFCWMSIDDNNQSTHLVTKPMPAIGKELDVRMANQFMIEDNINYCYLEYSPSIHGKFGSSSMIKFGRATGIMEGLLAANRIPYELINPRKWQNEVHRGFPSGDKPKEKAKLAVSRLFPSHSFLKTERSTKPHEGMVDAALIAEYARRCLNRAG